jgi:hypothetical protein
VGHGQGQRRVAPDHARVLFCVLLSCQHLVGKAHHQGSVPNRARHALRCARPHVAGREHARPDRLEQMRLAVAQGLAEVSGALCRARAAEQVAGVVGGEQILGCFGTRVRADHHVDRGAVDLLGAPVAVVAQSH